MVATGELITCSGFRVANNRKPGSGFPQSTPVNTTVNANELGRGSLKRGPRFMVNPSRVSGCAPKAGAYARSLFMVERAADDAPYGSYLAGSGARP